MPGPIVREYKNGSIVYFERDKSDDIFVLQKGRILLTFTNTSGVEIKEDVKIGEFFGVKSSIGKYPREETAQVLGGASVLVFKPAEFEAFVSTKTHLIIKMLKVFSSQLRSVHKQVREILGQGEAKNSAYELMNVAEVFHKNSHLDHASYAYRKYLENYPDGMYMERANVLLDLTKQGAAYPISMPELTYKNEGANKGVNLQDMLKTLAVPQSNSDFNPNSIVAKFDQASTLLNADKIKDAITLFEELTERTDSVTGEDDQAIENALFYLGKAYYKGNDFGNALQIFSMFVKKYPNGQLAKENLYHLALSNEQVGEKDKAIQLFQKVASMAPLDDSISEEAKKKVKAIKK